MSASFLKYIFHVLFAEIVLLFRVLIFSSVVLFISPFKHSQVIFSSDWRDVYIYQCGISRSATINQKFLCLMSAIFCSYFMLFLWFCVKVYVFRPTVIRLRGIFTLTAAKTRCIFRSMLQMNLVSWSFESLSD